VRVSESVVSTAVNTGDPIVVDFTVKVTIPSALDAPDEAEIVSVVPRLEVSVTVFPETGLELASSKVTVTVEVAAPSATTIEGADSTVETPILTPPTVNVTVAVEVMTEFPSVWLVAV
jgi:hypothetical protein